MAFVLRSTTATSGDAGWEDENDVPETRIHYVEDFLGDAGQTPPPPWVTNNETVNSTSDYTSGAGGIFRLSMDNTVEAQATQVTWGASSMIDPTKSTIVKFRVMFQPEGATFTPDERLVIGLCSAHTNAEDSLDNVTYNCWFRVEGADNTIYVEADDNSVDTDDQNSGVTIVKNAWTWFTIDCSDLSDVKMYIDGVEQSGGTIDWSGVSGQFLDPIVCMQRGGGNETNSVRIDVFVLDAER